MTSEWQLTVLDTVLSSRTDLNSILYKQQNRYYKTTQKLCRAVGGSKELEKNEVVE